VKGLNQMVKVVPLALLSVLSPAFENSVEIEVLLIAGRAGLNVMHFVFST
jgi:hypothetical protein